MSKKQVLKSSKASKSSKNSKAIKAIKIKQQTSDNVINIILDTISKNKQAIVFCNTKRGAESQAEKISKKIKEKLGVDLAESALKVLSSPTKQCKRLAVCLNKEIAFHHAGLAGKQRELVEDNFRSGKIKVICSTPTLAMGLDLPAFRTILKDLKRFSFGREFSMNYIPVLEFEQMCVPGSTLIKTDCGELSIEKLINSKKHVNVLTFDVERKKFEFKPILKTFKQKTNSLLALKTTQGYSLKLTENHPVLVNRNNIFSWIPAKKVLKEDKLLITSKSEEGNDNFLFLDLLPKKDIYVPEAGHFIRQLKAKKEFSDLQIAKLLNMEKKNVYHYKYDKKAIPYSKVLKLANELKLTKKELSKKITCIKSAYGKKINLPEYVTKDFLWLVGLIASDGTLTRTIDKRTNSEYVKIRISNKNKKLINKAKKILELIVEDKVHISRREDDCYDLEKGCTLLARIIRDNFGINFNKKSLSVRTPEFLKNASKELIGAYVGGVFDGDGSYDKKSDRILICSGSKKFAYELQQLLLRLGIISRVVVRPGGELFVKGKKAFFNKTYNVIFSRKIYVKRFAKYSLVLKTVFTPKYSSYNNLNKYYDKDYDFLTISSVKQLSFNDYVYNLEVESNNNYFANNILVHNCGRAGRPGKEDYGEAICIATTDKEKENIIKKYINGEPEAIISKLAVEPVLRTYVLSLIASEFIDDKEKLYNFFENTFYAKQYGDIYALRKILDKVLLMLQDWGFVENDSETKQDSSGFVSAVKFIKKDTLSSELKATLIGKRVSELYLDPLTANELIESLKKANLQTTSFAINHLLSNCLEIRPLLRVKNSEIDDVANISVDRAKEVLIKEPVAYSYDYERYLETIKTAVFLEEWINESNEEYLLEKYNVRPGEIKAKIDIADWLLYASEELSRLMKMHSLKPVLSKLRLRLKHGAKEELLPLLRLKGIGKVRARKLFENKVKDLKGLQDIDITSLVSLIGKAMAINVKKQVGQEFDPQKIQVPVKKRKGQMSLLKYS